MSGVLFVLLLEVRPLRCMAVSLPPRVRGLKLGGGKMREPGNRVAPLAGAWIEIIVCGRQDAAKTKASLPSRERGLKYQRTRPQA